ncbi:hypothetical protein ACFX5F_07010 [Flavobacterium sp. ZS1P70]|uniref:Uncharacterized protein n=1 Tax=Flavobacterium zhoui TaxID=3230414 RepID=A0ABW6I3V8_9FLAO
MMQRITIAKGDGKGPEIVDATLKNSKVVGTLTNLNEVDADEKISLLVGAIWLICGIVFTVLEPNNIFFTLFLGLGIFFSVYALTKTQKF